MSPSHTALLQWCIWCSPLRLQKWLCRLSVQSMEYTSKISLECTTDYTYLACGGIFLWQNAKLKNQIMSRYPKFVKKLLHSPSKEIWFLSRILLSVRRSQLNRNVYYLSSIMNVNILEYPHYKYKQLLPRQSVPVSEQWRFCLLSTLLNARNSKNFSSLNLNKTQCNDMINSLCSA